MDTSIQQVTEEDADALEPAKPKTANAEQARLFFETVFQVADEARRPRQSVWEKAWDLYIGRVSWAGKAEWQSKIPIAKVRPAVDRAAATFRRALVRVKNFYSISSESKLGTQKGLFTKSLLDMWFDNANFIQEFTTALKAGLITSTIIMKVFWHWKEIPALEVEESEVEVPTYSFGLEVGTEKARTKKPKQTTKIYGCLGVKAVDPFKFWVVPGTNGQIERTESCLADIEDLAKQGIYSKAGLEELRAAASSSINSSENPNEQERKGEQTITQSKFLREVILYHYWGDIFDEDGSCLMRNATFTVAGTQDGKVITVLREPRENPFFHGKSPYIVGTPYTVPFSTYNRGIVEDVIGIASMITELSNLIADGAMFDAIKAFEVDVDLVHSPSDIAQGIYPGLALRKKGLNDPTGNKQVVRAIDVGKIPQEALAALNMFERDFQEGTWVTEFVSGGLGQGGSRTATEVQSKTTQALEGLDDAARTVEETVINPALELGAKTIYQFHEDYTLPRLIEEFPQVSMMMRNLHPAERYVVMFGSQGIDSFNFRAQGISVMLDKQQNLEKISSFLQLGAHVPGFLQQLNAGAVAEEIVTSLGWNPAKMLVNQGQNAVQPVNGPQPGQPFPAPAPGAMTPAQSFSASQGAEMGGAANNPMAPEGGLG